MPGDELPGVVSGVAPAGDVAFVALSQGRGLDLPVTRRLAERECGVWAVDADTGDVRGWLRFDDLVQELGGIAVLPHPWPELT